MIFRGARSESGKYPRGREAPPSGPRAWLARSLLLGAALLAAQAIWLPAKAALAQELLAASWQ